MQKIKSDKQLRKSISAVGGIPYLSHDAYMLSLGQANSQTQRSENQIYDYSMQNVIPSAPCV